jgi:hypothetical protein
VSTVLLIVLNSIFSCSGRDMSLENVVLAGESDRCVLIDMGMCLYAPTGDDEKTRLAAQPIQGKMCYM